MNENAQMSYSAFEEDDFLTQGTIAEVALGIKKRLKQNPAASILAFCDATGMQMDFNLSGTDKEVLNRLQIYLGSPSTGTTPSGPGRPRLGVVAREISLLPRHWEWLATQTGGASAAIRRLVDEARKNGSDRELKKNALESAYRVMTALAGNRPHYEDAVRRLFARDKKAFKGRIAKWPTDVKNYILKIAEPGFD